MIWHDQIKSVLLWMMMGIMFIMSLIFSTSCQADELSDLKNRVRELEDRFDDELLFQRDEHLALFDQLNEVIKLNMYIGLDYESFEKSPSSFKAESLELVSEMNFRNKMTAFFEIEFKGEEAEVEQGWFEYLIDPLFNPRFGAILVPFGAYNLNHFNYQRALAHRPIAMKHVVPVTWREAGAGFTGTLFIENEGGKWIDELGIDYQLFLINGFTGKFEPTSSRGARGAFNQDNNNNKAIVGHVGFTLNEINQLGLSVYHGEYEDHLQSGISGLDIDWSFQRGPFEFLGEYARFNLESASSQIPKNLQGGYAQVNFNFWPKSFNKTVLGKKHEDPTFILVLRYGEAIIEGRVDKNEELRWTAGINYRPYQTFVARIEYQWNQAANIPIEHGDNDGLVISFAAAF
ncbi:MAG: hypothetical protein ACE5FY_03455 [Nitrospiria bacterium]